MRRIFFSSPLVLLVSVCALFLQAELSSASAAKGSNRTHRAPKQVRRQIDELEQQFRAATLSGDAAMMDPLLSDDYVGISWTGQVNTKANQLDRIRERTLVITRMDLSETKVKLLGPVAIVTCAASIEGTNDGNPISGVFRYTRVYQRLSTGAWKITNFEATRVPRHPRDTAPALPPNTPSL